MSKYDKTGIIFTNNEIDFDYYVINIDWDLKMNITIFELGTYLQVSNCVEKKQFENS